MKAIKQSKIITVFCMSALLVIIESADALNLTPGVWTKITPPGRGTTLGIGLSQANPSIIYLNCDGPMYKSTDGGGTWTGTIGTAFYEYDGKTTTSNPWACGCYSWTVAVDPTDANIVWAFCAFKCGQGPLKTTDGGNTWRYILSSADGQTATPDIYAIAVSTLNHLHLLMTFHSNWNWGSDAGIAESKDGGNTWIMHKPQSQGGTIPNCGAGEYAFFLEEKNDRSPDTEGKFWIYATQSNGYWRTEDAGQTWTRVANGYNMQHGACGLYRASNGNLFIGAVSHLLRSTDNGRTWADCGAMSNSDGYNTIIGDGINLYALPANTGQSTTGSHPMQTSLETDGTHWTAYNTQQFSCGPGWAVADKANHIVYTSNWGAGAWALKSASATSIDGNSLSGSKNIVPPKSASIVMPGSRSSIKSITASSRIILFDIRGKQIDKSDIGNRAMIAKAQ